MRDSYNSRTTLKIKGKDYHIYSLKALMPQYPINQLPYCLKILLENLLRFEDGSSVSRSDIEALANWQPDATPAREIAFRPARVVLQDFTGVPAVVDLAAMREAMQDLQGDPELINPLTPVELVIDHSVQVDVYRTSQALDRNAQIEFERNKERYAFLRWGQNSFSNFKVVPPDTGIVHQVNLEYLARVVFTDTVNGSCHAYPDTVVGTDSHTTMINGLGILGWGVGGIEAEAGMLGQPMTMLLPEVVGFRLTGVLPEGANATDLVLTITQILREFGVVGKFVEFFGDGLDHLPLAERATIANMAPEYGATCGIFPIDKETLRYLALTGRSSEQIEVIETYTREQGLFREAGATESQYNEVLVLDMSTVEPCIAGPKRPQDRISLRQAKVQFEKDLHILAEQRTGSAAKDASMANFQNEGGNTAIAAEEALHVGAVEVNYAGQQFLLKDGAVVIAAITSCTNTSNPAVLIGAGLLARKARQYGLDSKPWVKTSLAPGSQVVTEYLSKAGLLQDLEALGFYLVGYGCTTCIGNSGPLADAIKTAIQDRNLITAAVLSGNRNFESRIHPDVRMNYLASPPLVLAYALCGTMDIDFYKEALGYDRDGKPVFLKNIWPTHNEIQEVIQKTVGPAVFRSVYGEVFKGDTRWNSLAIPETKIYQWDKSSTYIRKPPFFTGISKETVAIPSIKNTRVLAVLGDSITTDHISPAGAIPVDSPAGEYLISQGVRPGDFNSYGSRRGNHEVMLRGTFANIRLRNRLAPETEGGWTRHQPSGALMTLFDAAMHYGDEGVKLIIIAGKEYGTGSSRDWAAKGTRLLGVRVVIAQSFERIHRSNLVGMGVLPLQFHANENAETLGLNGESIYSIEGLQEGANEVTIVATPDAGGELVRFSTSVRIDTPKEWEYFINGGILHYVLRQLAT